MGTKVSDLPTYAKVTCPKKTGEVSNDADCQECGRYSDCMTALNIFMGNDGLRFDVRSPVQPTYGFTNKKSRWEL